MKRAVPVLIVAVAIVAGFGIGRLTGGGRADPDPRERRVVRSGPFTLQAPADWREPERPTEVPGLSLDDRVELAPPSAPAQAALVVGVAAAGDGSLLGRDLQQALGGAAPVGAVRLANLEALQYDERSPGGSDKPLELYATPIEDGALTAVCFGGDRAFRRSCDAAVATLRLTRGTSYPLGPDRRFREGVDRVVRRLDRARRRRVAAMRAAPRAQGQAAAAEAVADAYAGAARRVEAASGNPVSGQARARLAFALDAAAAAWRGLADAAREADPGPYANASEIVDSAEAWVGPAIQQAGESGTAEPVAPAASPTPAPEPIQLTEAATTERCDAAPESARGFLEVCAGPGRTSLSVENISNLVLAIRHDGRAQPPIEPTTSDNDRLVGAVVRSRCAGTSCTLRPRASVRLEGNGPVSISFAVVFEDTMAATLAHLAASKLTPPQRRRPQAVVDCVEGVGSTFGAGNAEEVLRDAMTYSADCTGLVKELLGDDPDPLKRQRLANRFIKGADALFGPLRPDLTVGVYKVIKGIPVIVIR